MRFDAAPWMPELNARQYADSLSADNFFSGGHAMDFRASLLIIAPVAALAEIRPAAVGELFSGMARGMNVALVRALRGDLTHFEPTKHERDNYPGKTENHDRDTRDFGLLADVQ